MHVKKIVHDTYIFAHVSRILFYNSYLNIFILG